MAGLASMIPGMKKFEEARTKVLGDTSQKSQTSAPKPTVGILDAAATSPAQAGWAPRSGVNGTTSPKGKGLWGV